jgi:hypothetical protein
MPVAWYQGMTSSCRQAAEKNRALAAAYGKTSVPRQPRRDPESFAHVFREREDQHGAARVTVGTEKQKTQQGPISLCDNSTRGLKQAKANHPHPARSG